MAGGAIGTDLADDVEDDVLGCNAEREFAIDGDTERLRFRLRQCLRRHHVLDFAGADAERERAEGSMRRCVRVAADDGHARLGRSQLWSNHMDDALGGVLYVEELDAELGAIFTKCVHLGSRDLIDDVQPVVRAGGWNVMVYRGDRTIRTARSCVLPCEDHRRPVVR